MNTSPITYTQPSQTYKPLMRFHPPKSLSAYFFGVVTWPISTTYSIIKRPIAYPVSCLLAEEDPLFKLMHKSLKEFTKELMRFPNMNAPIRGKKQQLESILLSVRNNATNSPAIDKLLQVEQFKELIDNLIINTHALPKDATTYINDVRSNVLPSFKEILNGQKGALHKTTKLASKYFFTHIKKLALCCLPRRLGQWLDGSKKNWVNADKDSPLYLINLLTQCDSDKIPSVVQSMMLYLLPVAEASTGSGLEHIGAIASDITRALSSHLSLDDPLQKMQQIYEEYERKEPSLHIKQKATLAEKLAPKQINSLTASITQMKQRIAGPTRDEQKSLEMLEERTNQSIKNLAQTSCFFSVYQLMMSLLDLHFEPEKLEQQIYDSIPANCKNKSAEFNRKLKESGLFYMHKISFSNIYKEYSSEVFEKQKEIFFKKMEGIINDQPIGWPKKMLYKWIMKFSTNIGQEIITEFLNGGLKFLREYFTKMGAHPNYQIDPTLIKNVGKSFRIIYLIMEKYLSSDQRHLDFDEEVFPKEILDPKYNGGYSENALFKKLTSISVDHFISDFNWTKPINHALKSISLWQKNSFNMITSIIKSIISFPVEIILKSINLFIIKPLQWIASKIRSSIIKGIINFYEMPKKMAKAMYTNMTGENRHSNLTFAGKEILTDLLKLIYEKIHENSQDDSPPISTAHLGATKNAIKQCLLEAFKAQKAHIALTNTADLSKDQSMTNGPLYSLISLCAPIASEHLMTLLLEVFQTFIARENNENLINKAALKLINALGNSGAPIEESRWEKSHTIDQELKQVQDNLLFAATDLCIKNILYTTTQEKQLILKQALENTRHLLFATNGHSIRIEHAGFLNEYLKLLQAITHRKIDAQQMRKGRVNFTKILSKIHDEVEVLQNTYKENIPSIVKEIINNDMAIIINKTIQLDMLFQVFADYDLWQERFANLKALFIEVKTLTQKIHIALEEPSDPQQLLEKLDLTCIKLQKEIEKISLTESQYADGFKEFLYQIQDCFTEINIIVTSVKKHVNYQLLNHILECPYPQMQKSLQKRVQNFVSKEFQYTYKDSIIDQLIELKLFLIRNNQGIPKYWNPETHHFSEIKKDIIKILKRFLPEKELSFFHCIAHIKGREVEAGILNDIQQATSKEEVLKLSKQMREKIKELTLKQHDEVQEAISQIVDMIESDEGSYTKAMETIQNEVRSYKEKSFEEQTRTICTTIQQAIQELKDKCNQVPDCKDLSLFNEIYSHPHLVKMQFGIHELLVQVSENFSKLFPYLVHLIPKQAGILEAIKQTNKSK